VLWLVAKVLQACNVTKWILCLQENTSGFTFAPGQWVDFHVPNLTAVGGYSICSTTTQLQQSGTIDLCVKRSGHPCAQWVHNEAAPGSQVCGTAVAGKTQIVLQAVVRQGRPRLQHCQLLNTMHQLRGIRFG
jgi:ferredoxin-NADP reductase